MTDDFQTFENEPYGAPMPDSSGGELTGALHFPRGGFVSDPQLAARNLADAANQVGATLVQVSTDFVFDGERATPYDPETQPHGHRHESDDDGINRPLHDSGECIPAVLIRAQGVFPCGRLEPLPGIHGIRVKASFYLFWRKGKRKL